MVSGEGKAGQGFPLEVRTSTRARRLRLEIQPGLLRLTVPRGYPEDRIEAFLRAQASWIEQHTEAFRHLAGPGEGPITAPIPDPGAPGTILFRGARVHLETLEAPRPLLPTVAERPEGGITLALPTPWTREQRQVRGRRALNAWFDGILHREALVLVETLGQNHDLIPTRILFGAARTRWGSCSREGVIRLNRRLIGAPPAVYRYVVLHEMAHLRFPHHQKSFWNLVGILDPSWESHANWLRRFGVALG
jgi:predicted metal-dependent hydrolase